MVETPQYNPPVNLRVSGKSSKSQNRLQFNIRGNIVKFLPLFSYCSQLFQTLESATQWPLPLFSPILYFYQFELFLATFGPLLLMHLNKSESGGKWILVSHCFPHSQIQLITVLESVNQIQLLTIVLSDTNFMSLWAQGALYDNICIIIELAGLPNFITESNVF